MENTTVTLLSEDKARLEQIELVYWVYYNQLTYRADSRIELEIEAVADTSRVKAGCMACTTTNILSSENGKHKIEIIYDTKNIGDFSKPVTFFYTKAGKERSILIKITGNVAR